MLLTNPQSDDPPRYLFINNSGLDSAKRIIFHAELDGMYLNFSVRIIFSCEGKHVLNTFNMMFYLYL